MLTSRGRPGVVGLLTRAGLFLAGLAAVSWGLVAVIPLSLAEAATGRGSHAFAVSVLRGVARGAGGAAADVLVAALLVLCVRGLVRACRRRLGTAP